MSGSVLRVQALKPLPGSGQTLVFSGTSAQATNAVGDQTKWIKIASAQDCYIELGANPTAVAGTSMFMAGDKADRYFLISPGHKIAAIQVSTGGTLYITEMVT